MRRNIRVPSLYEWHFNPIISLLATACQASFKFAALVEAAMCSAFVRGTHDRWP
jgi:hypothetical protein